MKGVRNFFINNFNPMGLRADGGFLFEAYVLSELLKSGQEPVKFWQDKNDHEVDFILDQAALEIKFKTSLKSEDFIGLEAFVKQYQQAKKLYLINVGVQGKKGKIHSQLPYVLNPIQKSG